MNHLTFRITRHNSDIDLDVDYDYQSEDKIYIQDMQDCYGNIAILTPAEAALLINRIREKEADKWCLECESPVVSGKCTNAHCNQNNFL